ncbi:hydrogen peroxide-dependent heme synthase [Kocuria atrinae]|uniref:hydrogen peroxide-dependent heme synthase n=1 Tax=Kocuria atrinae TaxID=592377 RepID=UPI0002E3CFA2|nr:hydrogen peroxide-dependent heme synthase [Kocuria atrinae]
MSEHVHAAQQSAVETEETTEEKLYWAVYTVLERTGDRTPEADSEANQAEFDRLVQELAGDNVTVRGVYDVSGMRDNADLMVWLTGDEPDVLQEAVRKIRRQPLLGGTRQVWNAMGVHRDAEFTRNHAPSYARGIAPEKWVCVYPFVRSYEWYYMNPERRAEMLKNHGMKARNYPQVLANTIACFGLNDFEWLLALEAPELVDLVDVMREFRNTEARLHVREEIPFYTGRRIETAEIAEVLR